MKRSGIPVGLLAALALVMGLCACENAPNPAYDPGSYTCTLSIHSVTRGETDPFTAQFVSDNGTVRLTITAPSSVSGVGFTVGTTGVSMTFPPYGEPQTPLSIPLSEPAAASIRELARLLSRPLAEAADKRQTEAGTVLVFDNGELTLDDTGLPVFAKTNEGRAAAVTYPPEISKESP